MSPFREILVSGRNPYSTPVLEAGGSVTTIDHTAIADHSLPQSLHARAQPFELCLDLSGPGSTAIRRVSGSTSTWSAATQRKRRRTICTTTSTKRVIGRRRQIFCGFSASNPRHTPPRHLKTTRRISSQATAAIRWSALQSRSLTSLAGVDGCLISWVDYKNELRQWNAEVLPLLVQSGLRQPFEP